MKIGPARIRERLSQRKLINSFLILVFFCSPEKMLKLVAWNALIKDQFELWSRDLVETWHISSNHRLDSVKINKQLSKMSHYRRYCSHSIALKNIRKSLVFREFKKWALTWRGAKNIFLFFLHYFNLNSFEAAAFLNILWWIILNYRSSRRGVFCEKGVLGNFAKFTGKHLC